MIKLQSGSDTQATQDLLTQHEMTQMACDLSPMPPSFSPPPLDPSQIPWGRLLFPHGNNPAIELLPKGEKQLGQVFNEHIVGRSNSKCDVVIPKTPPLDCEKETKLYEWARGMISNTHCKLYCLMEDNNMNVYVEDTSGNGTRINGETLLKRGQKRLLHTGDEICLISKESLRKKIHSARVLVRICQQYTLVFTTCRNSTISPMVRKRLLPDDVRRIERDYDLRDVLGTGTVGEVRRAIHRQTGQERAVKVIRLASKWGQDSAETSVVEAEAAILKNMRHPYIVELYDVYVCDGSIYLVMELLPGGDLFDRISAKGTYSETDARRVLRRLLSTLYYLHEKEQVVHRDLKPENILMVSHDDDVSIKLTDFGLAKTIDEQRGLQTFCGTPQYFAPEVLSRQYTVNGRGRYGKQADLWSVGVIMYILLSGAPPFLAGETEWEFGPEFAETSEEAKDLVRKLLVPDPRQRLNVLQACQHEWMNIDDGDTHTFALDDPATVVQPEMGETLIKSAPDSPLAEQTDDRVEEPDKPPINESESNSVSATRIESHSAETVAAKDNEVSNEAMLPSEAREPESTKAESYTSRSSPTKLSFEAAAEEKIEATVSEGIKPVKPADERRPPLSPVPLNRKRKQAIISFSHGKSMLLSKPAEALEPAEIEGDEIRSNFSDDNESIQSYGDDADKAEDSSEEEDIMTVDKKKEEQPVQTGTPTSRKKRRVTSSIGEINPAPGANKKQQTLGAWLKRK